MSINKIIVNTTTGAQAATSINSTIDLAEAAATLGANEFTGDQLINGTSKQVFVVPAAGETVSIASVTGLATPLGPITQVSQGWNGPAGGSITGQTQNSFVTEVFQDDTRARGTTKITNFLRDRSEARAGNGNIGAIEIAQQATATGLIAFADTILIGANANETRNVINIGHDALPNLNLRGSNINTFGQLTHNGQVGLFGDVVINNGSLTLLPDMPATFGGNTVITPVASLPAGAEGQIAFTDGKMFVFVGGSFKEVQFVTV